VLEWCEGPYADELRDELVAQLVEGESRLLGPDDFVVRTDIAHRDTQHRLFLLSVGLLVGRWGSWGVGCGSGESGMQPVGEVLGECAAQRARRGWRWSLRGVKCEVTGRLGAGRFAGAMTDDRFSASRIPSHCAESDGCNPRSP
jgi:hypothetical protein